MPVWYEIFRECIFSGLCLDECASGLLLSFLKCFTEVASGHHDLSCG